MAICQRGAKPTRQVLVNSPVAILARPDLDLAIESCANSASTRSIGHNVVAANFVRIVNGLHQWKLGVGGRVDLDGRRASTREDLLVCHSKGENIHRVRWNTGISLINRAQKLSHHCLPHPMRGIASTAQYGQ